MPTEHRYALPNGHILHQVYRMERVLGAGAFGITYLARHLHLGSQAVIKEYLPEFAVRQNGRVQPPAADRAEVFNWGLSSFFKEAKLLHGLSHQNIVEVKDLFEENGTAYFVMPYMGSRTLVDWIGSRTMPPLDDLMNIFLPLLDGLAYIHRRGLLHRDIKPANILLTENQTPVLIDFGSARFTANHQQPLTKVLTPKFAPIEQYDGQSDSYHPALDIYSLSVCLYQAITGHLPQEAIERQHHDNMMKLAQQPTYRAVYPDYFLNAVDKGLSLNAHNRFQSAEEMKLALSGNAGHQHQTADMNRAYRAESAAPTQVVEPETVLSLNKPQTAPQPKPQAKIKKTAPKSSGSLKKLFGRLAAVCVLGGAGWAALPMLKNMLPDLSLSGKKNTGDKPYRDTVEIQINGKTAVYSGWLKNGVAEDNTGTATLKFADGTQCTVGMSQNQRSGTGTCVYPKGSVYEGAWKKDLKHGYGKYTAAKSSPITSYEGGFVNGKLSGKGIMKYKNGAVFAGEFASDDIKNQGKGAMTGMFGMNVRCEGTFTKTRANCQFKQGNAVIQFIGKHKNGLWDGEGEVVIFDNGKETDRYRAVFRNGDMQGEPIRAARQNESDTAPTVEQIPAAEESSKSAPKSEFDDLF